MNLSPADLAKILAQPGYAIAPGSLWEPSTTQQGAGDAQNGPEAQRRRKPYDFASILNCRLPGPSEVFPWSSERIFCRAIADERDRRAVLVPEYRLLHHIPNENSHREPGVLGGVYDWHLPAARGGYYGFWCETKIGKNTPSDSQVDFARMVTAEGHYCVVVWDSVDLFFDECEKYLRGEP